MDMLVPFRLYQHGPELPQSRNYLTRLTLQLVASAHQRLVEFALWMPPHVVVIVVLIVVQISAVSAFVIRLRMLSRSMASVLGPSRTTPGSAPIKQPI